MKQEKFDAIILAGGENEGFERAGLERSPALLEVLGKPMVSYVADALAASQNIGKIYAAGPAKKLAGCPLPSSAVIIEGGGGIIDTIKIAMAALGHQEKVLVATTDIPLLTKEAVDDFLRLAGEKEAQVHYAVIEKKIYEQAFAGSARTYVRLREGAFTGGNLFLTEPSVIFKCAEVAEQITAKRKNPAALCRMLGWKFVLKFILGRLKIKEAEDRVGQLLGVKGVVFPTLFPEIGADVDKPDDVDFVVQKMKNSGV